MSTKISEFNGAKHWQNSIFDENFKVFKENLSYAQQDRATNMKMEEARYGNQYSVAETKQLLAFRQAPLPISISSAISDTADALQVSAKPTVDVAPIITPYNEEKSEQSRLVAGVFKHAIQKDWFDSLGGLQYDKAIFDRTTTGTGILYTVPRMEFGEFKVDVKHISWKYFIPDPASKDYLFGDSDNMVIAMPITKTAAYKFVQSIEPDLTKKQFEENWVRGGIEHNFPEEDTTFGGGALKDRTLFMQRLSLEVETSFIIVPNNVKNAEDYNAGEDIAYRTASTLTDTLKNAEQTGEIKIIKKRKLSLVEHTSVAGLGYKIVYPIDKYNAIPVHYDHRGTPYTYSLMWRLYPLQRAMNKFIMSSILNMALLNTTKILAEEDSILDEDNWVQSASIPNAILKYKLPVPGFSKPPEIIKPIPMDSAFLAMPQYLTSMMEYISGIYAPMQGNPEGSSDVFSTVASLQSAGGQKIKRRQAHADASLSRLGEVMAMFYKEYAPMNGFSYRRDEDGKETMHNYNELTVNKDDNGKLKVGVNPENDLRSGFRNVRFISTGSMGYESATEAAMLTNLATQLKQPDLIPLILERMNIPGIHKVSEKMDRNKQLTNQTQQQQKTIEELTKKTKQSHKQIETMMLKLVQAKAEGKLDVELEKFKSNPVEYIQKGNNFQGED